MKHTISANVDDGPPEGTIIDIYTMYLKDNPII